MSWNHRVVVTGDGTHQVAEVYYEDDGTPRAWGATVKLAEYREDGDKDGDCVEALLWTARSVIRALYEPVLYVRNGELTEVKGE